MSANDGIRDLQIALFVAAALTSLIALVFEQFKRAEKRKREDALRRRIEPIRGAIVQKITAGVRLSVQDIIDIAIGLNGNPSDGVSALLEAFARDDGQIHSELSAIIAQLRHQQPFADYPEEVRPSLAKLAKLCSDSHDPTDRDLMLPLHNLLKDYVAMKADHNAIKRQSRWSYIFGIVGIFIGIVGLFLAMNGPSKSDIAEIRRLLENDPKRSGEP